MKNSKITKFSSLFIIPSLFLLSGCGDIEIPESIPTPTPIEIKQTENIPTSSTETEQNSCTALKEEKESLSEAITILQTNFETCKTEKDQLASLSYNSQSSSNQIKEISPLLKKIITELKQEEFKFDSCGNRANVQNALWYKDFQKSLTGSTLYFNAVERQLEDTDFYSVCTSSEGKIALFLGASSGGKKEFHMIKYNFENKNISEAILIDGTCELCPNKFGKRFGPYITLNGAYGGTNKVFNYYYDSNIIETK